MSIPMGNHAKLAMIFAQTDPGKGHRGLACFLVETEGNAGYMPQVIHHKMGLHGSDTAEIGLNDCHVPEDAMLGHIGDGFKVAMSSMLADMKVQTDAARMLVGRAGALEDAGKPNTTETSIAKLYATEAAVACANTAIQVHGGSGYVDDHPVERYFRDVRVTTLYEGTSQIQKLIIGRALTGINALVPS